MGMFDDLIPTRTTAKAGGGMFDDLIPSSPSIDFSRPIPEVRAEIAKLPEAERAKALDQWADAYVANERKDVKKLDVPGVVNPHRLPELVRNFAKGTIVGSYADELNAATNAGLHKVTGGSFGAPYDESVAYQRAVDRALQKESPIGSTVTQVAGGLASGGPVAKKVFEKVTSIPGRIAAGGGFGGAYSYLSGFGEEEGDAGTRHGAGMEALPTGVAVGSFLPPAIAGGARAAEAVRDFASPTIARIGGMAEDIQRKIGFPASADGAVPDTRGARAAAEQTIANQLVREGVKPGEIGQRFDELAEAGRYHASGQAQDTNALVDFSPGMQRLARTAVTESLEGGRDAKRFIEARQTGLTPAGTTAQKMADVGLPTRERFAPPVTGARSMEQVGTDFSAGAKNLVPMGQGERFVDALKRAFRIKDTDFHGHAGNAARTDDALIEAARAEAIPAYGAMRDASKGYDIRPHIQPVVDEVMAAIKSPETGRTTARILAKGLREFTTDVGKNRELVSSMSAFDEGKRAVDTFIETAARSGDNNVGRILRGTPEAPGLLRKLLDAVDAIEPNGIGQKYKDARGRFSSRMEAIEAIQTGREAAKVGGDEGMRLLESVSGNDTHEKLARLGILGHVEKEVGRQKHGANKADVFDTPNMNKLLAHAIERTKGADATFADRPQRFGRYVDAEKAKVETRDIVQGGSKTDRNTRDVESFDIMSRWNEIREASSSVTMLTMKAAAELMNKLFGMRADTAASIVRMLFTADPIQRARVIQAVEARMGRERFEHFTRLLEESQRSITAATARQSTIPEAE